MTSTRTRGMHRVRLHGMQLPGRFFFGFNQCDLQETQKSLASSNVRVLTADPHHHRRPPPLLTPTQKPLFSSLGISAPQQMASSNPSDSDSLTPPPPPSPTPPPTRTSYTSKPASLSTSPLIPHSPSPRMHSPSRRSQSPPSRPRRHRLPNSPTPPAAHRCRPLPLRMRAPRRQAPETHLDSVRFRHRTRTRQHAGTAAARAAGAC